MPCHLGVSKFINLILNHHTRITRLNAHHRFRVDCVIGWNTTWKEDPLHHVGNADGSGYSLPNPQSCMPHCIDGMAGEQLNELNELPHTQRSGRSRHSTQSCCGQWTITRRHICLPRVYSERLRWCKHQGLSPILNMVATWEPESRKQTL